MVFKRLAICISPLLSSTMGYIGLGERLTIFDAIGAVFVVTGVALAVYGRQRELKNEKMYQQLQVGGGDTQQTTDDATHNTLPPFYANKQHRSGESIELTEYDLINDHDKHPYIHRTTT